MVQQVLAKLGSGLTVTLALAVAALSTAAPASGQRLRVGSQEPYAAESPHPYAPGTPPGQLVWSEVITHPGAHGMWVHFAMFDLAPGDWVVVRDPAGAVTETLPRPQQPDLDSLWSALVPGDTLVIDLWSQSATPGFGIVIDLYGWMFPPLLEVSPPGSAQPLRLFKLGNQAVWEDAAANGAEWFNVYRGDVDAVTAGSYGACFLSRVTTNAADSGPDPTGGEAWFYLVTGAREDHEGIMGLDSLTRYRANESPCP